MYIKNRYDFVLFFDVQEGNPTGDPDAEGFSVEAGRGLVTDVCLKKKVRNFVLMEKKGQKPFDIFNKKAADLNLLIDNAYNQKYVMAKSTEKQTEAVRQWMCAQYYDIRTFGAEMTTGKNAGQVEGAIHLTSGSSVEPIVSLKQSIVPYGLYRAHGFISPHLAAQTLFSDEDLNLFWEALENIFDHDHTATSVLMETQRIIVFKHENDPVNAHANTLLERVTFKRITEGPARDFKDYQVLLDGQEVKELRKVVDVKLT